MLSLLASVGSCGTSDRALAGCRCLINAYGIKQGLATLAPSPLPASVNTVLRAHSHMPSLRRCLELLLRDNDRVLKIGPLQET